MIVVDGYNLIGQESGRLSDLFLDREREGLVRRLGQLAAVSGERFLVVFDGAVRPDGSLPLPQKPAGKNIVMVEFSKPGESADTWIVKYFLRRPGRSTRLATRDHKLAQKVRKLGFKVDADLARPEAYAEPHLSQPLAATSAGGDLFSSLDRKSREALDQARKKAKKQ